MRYDLWLSNPGGRVASGKHMQFSQMRSTVLLWPVLMTCVLASLVLEVKPVWAAFTVTVSGTATPNPVQVNQPVTITATANKTGDLKDQGECTVTEGSERWQVTIDGNVFSGDSGTFTKTFTEPGTYTINISGVYVYDTDEACGGADQEAPGFTTVSIRVIADPPPPPPPPEPCGEYHHVSWGGQTVTWRPDANGNPEPSIAPATEFCRWDDPCANTMKPLQSHPRPYTKVSDGPVQIEGQWYRSVTYRADSGCEDGLPAWSAGQHPLPLHWTPDTSIQNEGGGSPRLMAPQDKRSDPPTPLKVYVLPGAQLGCAVEEATDSDHWTVWGGGSGDAADEVTYKWTGSGTFEDTTSAATTWTAPTTSGSYTLTCTVDDKGDGGRDDEAVPLDVTVEVVSITLEVDGPNTLAAGAKGSDVHKAKFKVKVTGGNGAGAGGFPVPGEIKIASGGRGPSDDPEDITATVIIDSSTTNENGEISGTLTSGNRIESTTVILDRDPGAAMTGPTLSFDQVWNDLAGQEAAWTYPPDFFYEEADTITYHMQLDRDNGIEPIDGHSMEFLTTGIGGLEWNPEIGEDWTGPDGEPDGEPDGDYEDKTYLELDPDPAGFWEWQGLSEFSSSTSSGGDYSAQQTIHFDWDFIVDTVWLDVYDNDVYGAAGAEE